MTIRIFPRIPLLEGVEKRLTMDEWSKMGLLGKVTATGLSVSETTAMNYSVFFQGVRRVSEDVGKISWFLYKRNREGDRERADEHPVYALLHDEPNPYMGSMTFRQTLMGHAMVRKGGFAEIEFDNAGFPVALWPLRPDRTWPEWDSDKRTLIYKTLTANGEGFILPAYRVFHVSGFGFDGIEAYATAQQGKEAIGLALALEKFKASFFGNSAQPGGYLQHPGKLGDPAHQRLKKDWEEKHQGLDNAHRVAILEEGMKFEQVGIAPEAAQMLESSKFQAEEIARWVGVTALHKIGILEHATFSNIEHQNIEYVGDSIMPWTVRIDQEAMRKLLLPRERRKYYIEHELDTLLRADSKTRWENYEKGKTLGVLNSNTIAKMENLPCIPIEQGGDNYWQQGPSGQTGPGKPTPPAGAQPQEPQGARMNAVQLDAAERILKRERADIPKLKADGFDKFLERHQAFCVEVLTPIYRDAGRESEASVASQRHMKTLENSLKTLNFEDNLAVNALFEARKPENLALFVEVG